MEPRITITLKLAAGILKVKPYRIIHLCETGCVTPNEPCHGRGTARGFSRDDLFVLGVSLLLQNAGITTEKIAKANEIFTGIVRHKKFRAQFEKDGLCGVIADLGTPNDPAMLHFKVPEPGVPSNEPACTYIESIKMDGTLPIPGNSRLGFIKSAKGLNLWPVRVTINLTFALLSIRLR